MLNDEETKEGRFPRVELKNKSNFLGKIIILIWIGLLLLSLFGVIYVEASDTDPGIPAEDNQYLEFRATTIKETNERKTINS